MRITGTVRLDLASLDVGSTFGDTHAVERLIQEAAYAPPGADIVFVVKRRQYAPQWALDYLRSEGQHLGSITVECSDPDTITRWVAQLRTSQEALLVSP